MNPLHTILQKPISVSHDSSISHVISNLLTHDISRFLMEKNNESKIISEKDIGLFLLNEETEKNLDDIPAYSIANRLTSVHEDMSIHDAAEIMIDKKIGSLGVKSNELGIIGIITKTDLARYYLKNFVGQKRVGDFMTISYTSMYSTDSLNQVVSKMIDEKLSRIFLKNQDNEPEGILTFRDLFHIALEEGRSDTVIDNSDPAISIMFTRKGFLSESGFGAITAAKDVMNKYIVSVDYNDDLSQACSQMIEHKVNGLGVKINGKLSGVISKSDVVKAITEIKETKI